MAIFKLLRIGFSLENALCALLDGACNKSTDTLAFLFGSSRHHVVRRIVEISRDRMGEALSWPTTFAAIALLRHTQILPVGDLTRA